MKKQTHYSQLKAPILFALGILVVMKIYNFWIISVLAILVVWIKYKELEQAPQKVKKQYLILLVVVLISFSSLYFFFQLS